MRFGVLGGVRAWGTDGDEVALGGPARRALLAALLLRPGQVVGDERLIDELYGEQPPKNAHHALQSQVSRLRRDGIMVERAGAGYLLDVDPDQVDVHRFLRLADHGRRALDSGDPARAAELLREALGWWRSPAPAVHLEERHVAALEDSIEADLRCGAHPAALAAELGELVARHPLRERLRGQLMRALHADGRQAAALLAYEEARRLLADELGADPSAELAALHQAMLRGEHAAAAPAAAVGAAGAAGAAERAVPVVSRVSVPLTSFVGRAEDAERVERLLDEARLVTLLGPGGVGKTRLAAEIAGKYPEVCFAELAALRDGADLAQALLGALGVRDSSLLGVASPADPLSRLTGALAERPMLLVLDNCEQIIAAVAALAEHLLVACPGLRVLTTSREPLGITPEHLWQVRPLPPREAVRLFADRAAAVRPDFRPDEAVERICTALDGLPLAIELAAARVRTHEPHELADRLDADRFPLLSRGSRTADARHQTLRAVVAWSWDLLTEAEQVLAARLTVFSGGATAAAAARVCGLQDTEDLLDSLADKSLVEVAGGRYRMLTTIRAFCADHLEDPQPVRQAHAAYFLDLAREADPHLRTGDQLPWLDRLAAEHGNIQAALRWAVESGAVDLGIRLVGAQAHYLWMRGIRTTVSAPAAALLERAGPHPDPALGDDYVLCALVAGRQAGSGYQDTAAAMLAERRRSHPLVAFLWPMMTASGGRHEVALAVLNQAERSPDGWERAAAQLIWAFPQMSGGDYAAAEENLTAALARFRALGDRWGSAVALDALAWLAGTCGDTATALTRTDEALALIERLGAVEDHADLLCNRGDLLQRDDPDRARADYERAAELGRRSGIPTYLASALRGLGDVARLAGDLAEARERYTRALELADPVWIKSAGSHTRLLVGMGKVVEAEGDQAGARAAYLEAAEVAVAAGALPESAKAIEALAGLADPAEAATLLGAALAVRGSAGPDDPEVERTAARARAALGADRYTAAHRTGARMTTEAALRAAGVSPELILASPLGVITALTGEAAVRVR